MNLGAPILDVQVEVKTSAKTTNAATASKPVSIVSGGVVSAPGYTPIVITKVTPASYTNGGSTGFQTTTPVATPTTTTATLSTNLNGDKIGVSGHDVFSHNTNKFNPNVRIVVNKNNQKPISPKAVQKQAEESNDEDQPELISEIKEGENISGSFVIVAAVVLIFVIVSLVVAKKMLNKSVMTAKMIQERELAAQADRERGEFQKVEMVNVDSHEHSLRGPEGVEVGPEANQYEEQYNAKQDFAIFQPKDQTVGGIMSLQEKQNIAENVLDESIDSQLNEKAEEKLTKLMARLNKLEKETSQLDDPVIAKGQKDNNMPEDEEMEDLENL